jgi:hypothetical protein
MATTVNAEVTVVDDTVITTEFGSPYVTLNVSNGYGVSDVCAAGFAAGASWGVCYNQFVPINQAAGNPMYMGPDGFYRLYANQNYIGPQPIVVNTPTEAAALVRLGDLLERATPDELAQLREAVEQTNGNLAELAGRLDAFEERLVAVETTNGEQNQRLDGIDAFVDPLQLELGNQTLDEFVTARIPVAETVMVDESWPARLWVLLVIGLVTLAAVLWLLLSKKEKKAKVEEEKFATQSDLKALKGKVEDKQTGLAAAHAAIVGQGNISQTLADRVRDVEKTVGMLVEESAAGLFACGELSDEMLNAMTDDQMQLLKVKCLDNCIRHVNLVMHKPESSTAWIELLGVNAQNNRIDVSEKTGTFTVLQVWQRLRKAKKAAQIEGVTAARKAA